MFVFVLSSTNPPQNIYLRLLDVDWLDFYVIHRNPISDLNSRASSSLLNKFQPHLHSTPTLMDYSWKWIAYNRSVGYFLLHSAWSLLPCWARISYPLNPFAFSLVYGFFFAHPPANKSQYCRNWPQNTHHKIKLLSRSLIGMWSTL